MPALRSWNRAVLVCALALLALTPVPGHAGSLSFLDPPAGAQLQLQLMHRFSFTDIQDLSTGTPQDPINISPVDLEFFPDGSGDWLLAQSTGNIAWLAPDFSLKGYFSVASANSLANFQKTGLFFDNEGMLGLTFDPNFAQNHYFYIHTTPEPASGVQIWRLTWDPTNLAGIWNSRFLVADIPKPQIADNPDYLHNHDGGNPSFGPDGMLYVMVGDGGVGGSDPAKNQAQSLTSFWGKALRIDPSGGKPPVIVARGLRNPFTSTWFNGSLVIGDVGGDVGADWEEINLLPSPDKVVPPVPNYGWNVLHGPCWEFRPNPADCAGFVDPIHGYRKDDAFVSEDPYATPGPPGTVYVTAIIAGPVYSGPQYEGYLDGVLIYADFVQGWIRGALLSDDGRVLADRFLMHYNGLIPGISKGPDGYVYVMGNDQGHIEIYRVTGPNVTPPPPPPTDGPPLVDNPTDPLPLYLSHTGFFPSFPALTPLDRAVPYTPLFPLWMDAADKQRFLLLPPGTSVDTSDPDSWVFPVGTLFVKHFGYELTAGGRREIETRVLQKGPEGWRFGTYVWNDAQTEAQLSDGAPIDVPLTGVRGAVPKSFTYEIPGTGQCHSCHSRELDTVIGFEPVQMTTSAVRALEDAGVLGTRHEAVPQSVAGATWSEASVRGYLHANCSHCHSEQGGLAATLGFSLDHRETDSVIGAESRRGRGTLVDPGNPAGSALVLMLSGAAGLPRMPPLGPQVVDLNAVTQVSNWVRSLGAQVPDGQHLPGRDRVELVELYQPDLDRYVIAASPDEATALETSLAQEGWQRTGYHFGAWQRPATQDPGPQPVLRGTPDSATVPSSFLGLRVIPSHARSDFPPARPDQGAAFYLYAPEGGACTSGFDPVYQTSVRRSGAPQLGYRYTTSLSVYRAMQQNGWHGDGVVMCAPR